MINEKYYQDIKAFPDQFEQGLRLSADISIKAPFDKVVLCGMGGSSLIVEMVNNFLAAAGEKVLPVFAVRGYELPVFADSSTLFFLVSHSGNTEETLACLDQVLARELPCVVFCSGGKLMGIAQQKGLPMFVVPGGLQPRLTSGYLFAAMVQILAGGGYIKDRRNEVMDAANEISLLFDEQSAKALALELKNKVPMIYSTDNVSGIARVTKVKFNENSKVQAFWNVFPELNHNEMVGWTNVVMNPYFIILKSKFSNPRNYKRIEVFKKLMEDKGLPVSVLEMGGETLLAEMLSSYVFMDYVTFYLAEVYGIDPEPVAMVEEFKKMLD